MIWGWLRSYSCEAGAEINQPPPTKTCLSHCSGEVVRGRRGVCIMETCISAAANKNALFAAHLDEYGKVLVS
jgi:hypothetical protein